jgi:hypothetical protein
MTVTTASGRQLEIPAHHSVFWPVSNRYQPGDLIDPMTVDVDSARASKIKEGDRIILDNRVEEVASVATL